MTPRRVSVIAVLATACFDPTVRPGLDCDQACPTGQVCVGGTCWLEGMVPDGAAPLADTAGGHDEDADGVPDASDGCPHLADPTQPDADGDRVNDACDPAPMAPTERIAYFDPFTVPEWTFSTGQWTYAGDTLEGRGDGNAYVAIDLGASFVEYGGRIAAVNALPHQLTMVLSADLANGSHYCEIWDDDMTPSFQITHLVMDIYMVQNAAVLPMLVPGPFRFQGVGSANADTADCLLALDSEIFVVSDTGPMVETNPMRIRLQGFDLSLDYLIQIVTE